jgi:hypothetical protein
MPEHDAVEVGWGSFREPPEKQPAPTIVWSALGSQTASFCEAKLVADPAGLRDGQVDLKDR